MKLISIACTLATAGSLVAASPSHRHHHGHVEKRQPNKIEVVTINEYVVGGRHLSLEEVCAGIASGTLRPSDGSANLTECQNNNAPPQEEDVEVKDPPKEKDIEVKDPPKEKDTEAEDAAPVVVLEPASSTSSVEAKSTPTPETSKPAKVPGKKFKGKPSEASAPASYQPKGKGLDREFPTNTIDCSTFPSEYGPIPIDWMKLGGWSGIQYVTETNGVITDVVNGVKGDRCRSGGMCSYACPPGWQKTQWPTVPPAEGRSVGGLFCNDNNKLELTNPTLSKSLCMEGTGATRVENKLSLVAMICRTDYPGTEGQTVPLTTRPGVVSELTCPDSKHYYQHDGAFTTAQYYINNKGVSKEDACRWNQDGSHTGNWAPSYLGVGQDIYGKTWVSIATTSDNKPKDYQPLDYAVEIVSEGDGSLSGKCRLHNGSYCFTDIQGNETCNEEGCTVQIIKGTAKFVLTDS